MIGSKINIVDCLGASNPFPDPGIDANIINLAASVTSFVGPDFRLVVVKESVGDFHVRLPGPLGQCISSCRALAKAACTDCARLLSRLLGTYLSIEITANDNSIST